MRALLFLKNRDKGDAEDNEDYASLLKQIYLMVRLAILAFDTSTEYLSVALACHHIHFCPDAISNEYLQSSSESFYFSHFLALTSCSRKIISVIDNLLTKAGLSLSEIDAIAYGAGPGSFTGLRISVGVAQGLAYATGVPLIAIDSLLATAEFARLSCPFTVSREVYVSSEMEKNKFGEAVSFAFLLEQDFREIVQIKLLNLKKQKQLTDPLCRINRDKKSFTVLSNRDARMNEVYWGAYSFSFDNNDWSVLSSPEVCAPFDVNQMLPFDCLAGNMSMDLANIFSKRKFFCYQNALPHAIAVARLAVRSWLSESVITPFDAQPIYVRNRVALTKEERLSGVKKL